MRLAAPHRRTAAIAAATACLLLSGTAAFAAPGGNGGSAEIQVDASCTSVDVLSTKAISNVVLQFADGSRLRFEDLPESRTGTFAGDDDVIEVVWVKSGDNKSGDGPGYGERFDLETSDCTEEPPATPEEEPQDTPEEEPLDTPEEEPQETGTTSSEDDDEPETDPEPAAPTQDDPEPEVDTEDGDRDGDDPEGDLTDVASEGDERDEDDDDEDGDQGTSAAVLNTELERDPSRSATPTPDLAPRVLGVVLDREVAAAVGDGIRPAGALPNAGAPALALLTAALGALGLGGGALRQRRAD